MKKLIILLTVISSITPAIAQKSLSEINSYEELTKEEPVEIVQKKRGRKKKWENTQFKNNFFVLFNTFVKKLSVC